MILDLLRWDRAEELFKDGRGKGKALEEKDHTGVDNKERNREAVMLL